MVKNINQWKMWRFLEDGMRKKLPIVLPEIHSVTPRECRMLLIPSVIWCSDNRKVLVWHHRERNAGVKEDWQRLALKARTGAKLRAKEFLTGKRQCSSIPSQLVPLDSQLCVYLPNSLLSDISFRNLELAVVGVFNKGNWEMLRIKATHPQEA